MCEKEATFFDWLEGVNFGVSEESAGLCEDLDDVELLPAFCGGDVAPMDIEMKEYDPSEIESMVGRECAWLRKRLAELVETTKNVLLVVHPQSEHLAVPVDEVVASSNSVHTVLERLGGNGSTSARVFMSLLRPEELDELISSERAINTSDLALLRTLRLRRHRSALTEACEEAIEIHDISASETEIGLVKECVNLVHVLSDHLHISEQSQGEQQGHEQSEQEQHDHEQYQDPTKKVNSHNICISIKSLRRSDGASDVDDNLHNDDEDLDDAGEGGGLRSSRKRRGRPVAHVEAADACTLQRPKRAASKSANVLLATNVKDTPAARSKDVRSARSQSAKELKAPAQYYEFNQHMSESVCASSSVSLPSMPSAAKRRNSDADGESVLHAGDDKDSGSRSIALERLAKAKTGAEQVLELLGTNGSDLIEPFSMNSEIAITHADVPVPIALVTEKEGERIVKCVDNLYACLSETDKLEAPIEGEQLAETLGSLKKWWRIVRRACSIASIFAYLRRPKKGKKRSKTLPQRYEELAAGVRKKMARDGEPIVQLYSFPHAARYDRLGQMLARWPMFVYQTEFTALTEWCWMRVEGKVTDSSVD